MTTTTNEPQWDAFLTARLRLIHHWHDKGRTPQHITQALNARLATIVSVLQAEEPEPEPDEDDAGATIEFAQARVRVIRQWTREGMEAHIICDELRAKPWLVELMIKTPLEVLEEVTPRRRKSDVVKVQVESWPWRHMSGDEECRISVTPRGLALTCGSLYYDGMMTCADARALARAVLAVTEAA